MEDSDYSIRYEFYSFLKKLYDEFGYEYEELDIITDIKTTILTYMVTEKINKLTTLVNTQYIDKFNISNFLSKEYDINTLTNEEKEEFVEDIINKIKDGSLDTILSSVVDSGENVVIKNEEETYAISTTESQNFNESRSLVDLGDCEKELRKVYNLSDDEKIIMFKIEKYIPGFKIPNIAYELFSQKGNINFDMDYCKDIKTNTYIAVDIDENELNKYNPDDKYYNDRCQSYTSENSIDISLYDRQNEFNSNNMSLCESNCEYKGYDTLNKIAECECNIKNVKELFSGQSQLLNEFKSSLHLLPMPAAFIK